MKKIPERKADTSMEKDKNKMENKKLTELLEHLEYELVQGTLDREIPAVVYDSRKVVPGCLFLCIGGANFDGHDFAAQVAEQGAGVLVVQKDSYPRPPVANLPPPSAPANASRVLFSAPYANVPAGRDMPDVAISPASANAVALFT